jgi:hypothetical protein
MNTFYTFLTTYHIGDFAGILGLIVTIVGFIITIVNVIRSKTAAEQTELAVTRIREDMKRIDTVSELSAAVSTLYEIRRMNLQKDLPMLPERCLSLRKNIVTLRASYEHFCDNEKKTLQDTIASLSRIENDVLLVIKTSNFTHDIAGLNKKINKHIDDILTLLVKIKEQIGRGI